MSAFVRSAYTCVLPRPRGGQVALVRSELFSAGGVGSVSSHLDKAEQTVNRSGLAGVGAYRSKASPSLC